MLHSRSSIAEYHIDHARLLISDWRSILLDFVDRTMLKFRYMHTMYTWYIPIAFIIFVVLFSLPPLVVTQIRGHIAGSSLPLRTTARALHSYREKRSALASLVDSRRIVLTHARRRQQLILPLFLLFLQINSISRHGGIRTHGPTLVAFESYHSSTGRPVCDKY